ncbi:homoserine dehydrogenase [Salinithrix halophila]|uniref:Homoserine dehydrogenase n=1 Tax=Salinithrix halophila TaxID=1485204 RepID=A0ABV8JFH0_9BACL
MERIGVGLLGMGTVGTGVFKALKSNQDVILKRTDTLFEVKKILVQDPDKKRQAEDAQSLLTTDFQQVLEAGIQVVVEAIGGLEPARSFIERAFEAGCHVVTANKELLAKHGSELERLARSRGVQLLYEASVGGGIPVLGTMRHLLKSNRIHRITGILNGTTNYILTEMASKGTPFDEVLAEAQKLGYAEADPTSDVDGFDAAYKLAILARLSFDAEVPVTEIPREGIREITPGELVLARRLGYAVKLLARGEQYGEKGPVSLAVGPALLPLTHSLSSVDGIYNAIHLEADVVQDITLVGQGAGEEPTASAVVEDLCNLYCLPPSKFIPSEETLLLPSQHSGGSRFIYLETAQHLDEGDAEGLKRRLQAIGLPVGETGISRVTDGSGVAFILRRWDPLYRGVLLAELGLEVSCLTDRPVHGSSTVEEAVRLEAGSAV